VQLFKSCVRTNSKERPSVGKIIQIIENWKITDLNNWKLMENKEEVILEPVKLDTFRSSPRTVHYERDSSNEKHNNFFVSSLSDEKNESVGNISGSSPGTPDYFVGLDQKVETMIAHEKNLDNIKFRNVFNYQKMEKKREL